MTEKERKTYEKYLINLAKDRDVINTAKEEGREEGEKIGMEKGMEKGIEKGMEKGIEKGMEKVAKQMKLENEPIEKIMKFTGLTQKQIESL